MAQIADILKADFSDMTGPEVLKFIKEVEAAIAKATREDAKGNKESIQALKSKLSIANQLYKLEDDTKDLSMEILALEEESQEYLKSGAEASKQLVDDLKSTIESVPILGNLVSGMIDFDEIGQRLQKEVLTGFGGIKGSITSAIPAAGAFNAVLTAGIGLLVAAVIALVAYFKQARDLSNEIGVSFSQATKLTPQINLAAVQLVGTGQDAKEIAGELIDAFGTVESVTASSIRDIGFLATRFGAASKDIIQVQKSLSDLFGIQVDQTEEVVRNIGKLAEAQGVAAGKVIGDLASNAGKFAEFSQDGAMGFAQAAIEARKVGTNLSAILGVADKLLEFETSLTAQFEAQVLTGKNLNLERARQLSLEGDIAGLTQEIQKTVGSLGEIQSMNVIERKAIAEAIGLSADDLLKVARGEAVAEQETVQDKLDTTNQLLAAQQSEREAILQATKQNNIGAGLVY